MFRAIILIDVKTLSVLLKRTFSCIESKYKNSVSEDEYQPISSNLVMTISNLILKKNQQNQVSTDIDHLEYFDHLPIYNIFNSSSTVVVAFKEHGFIFSCITYENMADSSETSHHGKLSQSIIMAYSLLQNMANHFVQSQSIDSFLVDLYKYISVGMPFGIPNEVDIKTALQMASSAASSSHIPSVKAPSWRPIVHKGKQSLHFYGREKVSAILFDREDVPNHCEIVGSVFIKADVEESPEISLDVIAPFESGVLTQSVYHPCVQIVDDVVPLIKTNQSLSGRTQCGSRKLRFCPPPEEFSLLHYKCNLDMNEIPFLCYYQMRGNEESASVLIQIRLDKKMRNSFEKFDVFIPFFNRGPIKSFEVVQQSSNVVLCNNRSAMLWSIGTKMASKTLDVAFEASIVFDTSQSVLVERKSYGFLSSYILLNAKMSNFTFSGLSFDNKSVELHPTSKIKVHSSIEFSTGEYKVWNTHGDIPAS